MTEMYIGSVNKDVRQIHTNQKRIIEEIRKLKSGTQELMKQANNWIDLYNGLSGALKEAGDIANWYEVLEKRANFIKNKLDEKMKATDTKTQYKDPEIGKSEEIVSETKKTEDVKIRKNNFEEKEKTNSDSKEKDTNTFFTK